MNSVRVIPVIIITVLLCGCSFNKQLKTSSCEKAVIHSFYQSEKDTSKGYILWGGWHDNQMLNIRGLLVDRISLLPVINANVILRGQGKETYGTITDSLGKFGFTIIQNSGFDYYKLVFDHPAYNCLEVDSFCYANEVSLKCKLQPKK